VRRSGLRHGVCRVATICGYLGERCSEHPILGERGSINLFRDYAAIEDIHAIALRQFLRLRGTEKEAFALLRLIPDFCEHFALSAHVDTTHRIVEEYDFGLAREGACDQDLLLVATAETEDRLLDVGGFDIDTVTPCVRYGGLFAAVKEPHMRQCPQQTDGQIAADGPQWKDAVAKAIATDVRDGAVDFCVHIIDAGSRERLEQRATLSVSVQPGEADNFPSPCNQPDLAL
jgi:hypothetical protein